MKPRLKLHGDGTVSLAAPLAHYKFNFSEPILSRDDVVANIQRTIGTVTEYQRRFDLPSAVVQVAIHGQNKNCAMGGRAGALRAMFGVPVRSSRNTTALDIDFRVPLAALRIARGGAA